MIVQGNKIFPNEKDSLLPKKDSNKNINLGFESASKWSQLTFSWLNPLLERGNCKCQLQPDDLHMLPLPTDDSTDEVMRLFEDAWAKECHRASSNGCDPSLTRAFISAFGYDFMIAGAYKIVSDALIFVGPQVLNRIIQFVRDPDASLWDGLFLTLLVTVSQILMSLCLRQYFFITYRVGLRVYTAVVVAVYRKSLRADSHRNDQSTGQITNLMSVDAFRLQTITPFLHAVWYTFFQIGLAVIFLWRQLGPSCLAGIFVIIFCMPLTTFVAKSMGRMQKKLMKAKDERNEITNEVLGNMKIIKLQAWEEPFQEKIESLRQAELKRLLYYLFTSACQYLLFQSVPLLIAVATFGIYVWSGNRLDVAAALTALALFDILRLPLVQFPKVVSGIVEAGVAMERISSFLTAPEHVPVGKGDLATIGANIVNGTFYYDSKRQKKIEQTMGNLLRKDATPLQLQVTQATLDYQWEIRLIKSQLAEAERHLAILEDRQYEGGLEDKQDQHLLSLKRLNFTLREGDCIAVVGSVGSGKSTLLKAILGEVRCLSGDISVNGKLSYFGQNPFIMNDTVKGNILFGSGDAAQYNQQLYDTAISACSLEHDLELLPNGDLCEIGEKGITMSGGQKARIAMARVLYHDADIFLLDDPLAAVDANVGRDLFENCIMDVLLQNKRCVWKDPAKRKKRTVILTTNALQHLSHPLINRILFLQDGRIVEEGSYEELLRKGDHFKAFLDSFNDSMGERNEEVDNSSKAPLAAAETEEPQQSQSVATDSLPHKEFTVNTDGWSADDSKKLQRDTTEDGATAKTTSLMTDEFRERKQGSVDLDIYMSWAKAAGGTWVGYLIILAYMLNEGTNVLAKWWLSFWSEQSYYDGEKSQFYYLSMYAMINLSAIMSSSIKLFFLMFFTLRASQRYFTRLLGGTLKAPMNFFDTTPLGRIINRFSKDIYALDQELPDNVQLLLQFSFSVMSTVFVISSVTPVFTIALVPIFFVYREELLYYTQTYLELKRLDSVVRSPIYALFGETLDGVSTIRAFSAQNSLKKRMKSMVDRQQHAYFLTSTAQCWIGVRLEVTSAFIICFACLAAVYEHSRKAGDESFAGLIGLSISYALVVTKTLNMATYMASEFEASMVSVERLEQYCQLESEAPRNTTSDDALDPNWPERGVIEFRNVKFRYRQGLPLVLKGINLVIPSHSKVGVIGRTGAGKSSLMTVILRLVELDEGKILIDGVDTRTLGLARLRSKIAVIPQDPVLFSGTVKSNLDPFNECGEDHVCEVLKRVGLMACSNDDNNSSTLHVAAVKSLFDPVLDGGSNFSIGEKQLLVIARALLRGARIVICDEATAAVDAETDARIQRILRDDLHDVTVLTVAHRLNTIMDSDYILAMSDGKAAEFDTPAKLLSKQDGVFKNLVDTWEEEHGSN